MATFTNTSSPTPFGIYDADTDFSAEADDMVTFVKRKLGDDILSVELTKKQIWGNFEEAVLEYSSILNKYQAKSQLVNFLGYATGSLEGGEEKYIRENLEFLARTAEPYAMEAGIGGSYTTYSGSIQLEAGRQDYNIYTELKDGSDNLLFDDAKGKIRVDEVFHFDPQAAYRFFDTTSAINYLNNEFSFESFTPETVFYILPVYEDILRAGQLDLSNRVRKSNYSFRISGQHIRLYPTPQTSSTMFLRIRQSPDPLSPAFKDATVHGVSNLNNIPFGNIKYSRVNSIGKQWVRQYTLALSKEQLGYIRGKFGAVPIPNANVTLNSADLIGHGREEKKDLGTQLRELLESMTYEKLMEIQSGRSEQMNKQLKFIPVPNGKAIFLG